MEASLIVALIALLGTISGIITNYRLNRKINESQSKRIEIEADRLLFDYKNTVIKDLSEQLTILRKEVDVLKTHEILHLEEKLRLEQRIETLINENKQLQASIIENKESYDTDLKQLKAKIKLLEKEIGEYKKQTLR